jgi:hypothetical protein
MDIGVLLTPGVPGIHSLLKQSDVIVVRHVSSSTRRPAARHLQHTRAAGSGEGRACFVC